MLTANPENSIWSLKGKLKATAVVAVSRKISYKANVEALHDPGNVVWKCDWGDSILYVQDFDKKCPSTLKLTWVTNCCHFLALSFQIAGFCSEFFPLVLSSTSEICAASSTPALPWAVWLSNVANRVASIIALLCWPCPYTRNSAVRPNLVFKFCGQGKYLRFLFLKHYQVLPMRIILISRDEETRMAPCYNVITISYKRTVLFTLC